MQYGYGTENERVSAFNAKRGDQYHCPGCGAPLVLKQGPIKASHFAHASNTVCDAFRENKTEWHIVNQSKFPEECQEVRLEKNGIVHIADVKYGDVIIEYQHSPMNNETFEERCNFYPQFGHLIWVFDAREEWHSGRIAPTHPRPGFKWQYPNQMLGKYDFSVEPVVDVMLQLDDTPDHEFYYLIEWNDKGGLSFFGGRCIDARDFREYINNINAHNYGFQKRQPRPRYTRGDRILEPTVEWKREKRAEQLRKQHDELIEKQKEEEARYVLFLAEQEKEQARKAAEERKKRDDLAKAESYTAFLQEMFTKYVTDYTEKAGEPDIDKDQILSMLKDKKRIDVLYGLHD